MAFRTRKSSATDGKEFSACFGLLPEGAYIVKSTDEKNPDTSQIIKSIDNAYTHKTFGTADRQIIDGYIDYLDTVNDGTKTEIVDRSKIDTLVFTKQATMGVDAIKKSLNTPIPSDTLSEINEEISACSYPKAGNQFCYIDIAREDSISLLVNGINQDKLAKKAKITTTDSALFILGHEWGHKVYNDNFIAPNEKFIAVETDTSITAQHKSEVFADVHSALTFLKYGKNKEFINHMINYRNSTLIKSSLNVMNGAENIDMDSVAKYNTTPALKAVITMYEKNPKIIQDMDTKDIPNLAKKITDDFSINEASQNEFIKNTKDKKSSPVLDTAMRMQHQFFKQNGYSMQENYGALKKFARAGMDEFNKASARLENQNRLQDNLLAGLKNGETYNNAFLNAYIETVKTVLNSDKENSAEQIAVTKGLLSEKDKIKSNLTYHDYFKGIKEPAIIKNTNDENIITLYAITKLSYAKSISSVISDISSGNITSKTKSCFKHCLKYAKYSHLAAQKSAEFMAKNPVKISDDMKKSIFSDANNETDAVLGAIMNENTRRLSASKENLSTVLNSTSAFIKNMKERKKAR